MRRLAACALAVAMLVSACAGETRKPPVIRPVEGLPSRFGDTDPHDWTGPAPEPGHYAVHGIDTARFQGKVHWDRAEKAGVSFAWIKATEGGDRVDPHFEENWQGAGRQGVARGAYHFFYWCRPAIEQAAWFIRNVPRVVGALPPVLDMEWTPFSPTCRKRPAPEVVRAEARTFLSALEAHYGTRPILYSTPDFFRRNEMNRLSGTEFWLRSTAGHPSETSPGHPWSFWQYTGTGLAPGVYTEVDLNAFNGSEAQFEAWRRARSQ